MKNRFLYLTAFILGVAILASSCNKEVEQTISAEQMIQGEWEMFTSAEMYNVTIDGDSYITKRGGFIEEYNMIFGDTEVSLMDSIGNIRVYDIITISATEFYLSENNGSMDYKKHTRY